MKMTDHDYTNLITEFFVMPATAEQLALFMDIPIARCYRIIASLLRNGKLKIVGTKIKGEKKTYLFRSAVEEVDDNYIDIIPLSDKKNGGGKKWL